MLNWYEGALGECISQKFEVVNSGNTGWCEVVEPVQITTLTEVGQYYRRLGLLAAITWALGSSDLTGSNVVAAGAAPTVVDAEMILVPGNCVFEEDTGSEFRRLGLMPFTAQDADGVSVSFGAAALRGPACKHARFDLRREFTCALCHHVPRLDDRPCYVDDHAAAMCEGFSHGLCILRNSAPQLAAQGSPLDAIKGVAGRVTMRPSAVYDLLKRKMSSNWRKAEEISSIEILLRKLPTKHPVSREQGGKLVAEELRNLVQGDLPRFEMPVSDRALRIGGAPVVQFKHSALERARERLRGLTAARVDHAAKIFTAQVTGAIASSSLIVWRASR